MKSHDRVTMAANAYVARSLELLRDRCPAQDDRALELGFPRWLEDRQGAATITRSGGFRTFRLTPDIWDPARVCAAREVPRMTTEGLREYEDLVAALQADPIIGERLGDEVVGGAGLGGGPLQAGAIVPELVLQLVEEATGFDASSEMVGRAVDRWVTHLRRERETLIVLAPLSDCVAAAPPVQLSQGIEIDELKSEEIAAMLAFGSWTISDFDHPRWTTPGTPTVHVDRTFAVRTSYSVPVVRGGGTPEEVEATLSAQRAAEQVAENVLLALRLFKAGRVGLRGVIRLTQPPLGRLWPLSALRSGHPHRSRGDVYRLAAHEGSRLAELYRQLVAARANDVIDTAARRFGYAADRSMPEDEIVDLVIAAESLFLSEIGPPSERGEMTYRLATRAAAFAHPRAHERRKVLRFMRTAYRARSGIVHSGRLDATELRDFDRQPASVADFANDLEELLRQSLRKAVRLRAEDEGFPPDWDQLLFPDSDS